MKNAVFAFFLDAIIMCNFATVVFLRRIFNATKLLSHFSWNGGKSMNLVERLLKIDKGEFSKKRTKKIYSDRLSEMLGEKAYITLQEIDPQEFINLSAAGLDENGEPIIEKTIEANSILAAAAMIDPPLKDADLMKHLGVATPAMAVAKLFKGEVNTIALEARKMAGFGDIVESDEEIKNL